ncbi:MAG: hypothetical protein JWO73_30 [Candidatus Taylorbacteria bacterium]|nr:hypothetical protein [Candidatus Taylorbacteria bacterium]
MISCLTPDSPVTTWRGNFLLYLFPMNENEQGKEAFEIGFKDMEKFLEKYEVRQIRSDFFQKMTLLVIASLGFITAIAWDQVLKLIFVELFESLSSIEAKLLYAVMITVIATVGSIVLAKIFLKKKSENADRKEPVN